MILGFIEHDRGKLNEASLEMLTLARDVAEQLDVSLEAVLIGEDGRPLAEGLAAYGVSEVHLVEEERLDDYAPAAWAQCIVELMEELEPEAVMATGTERGNEVMAYVAARTDLPMAANCIEIDTEDEDAFQVTRVRWGGSLLEEALLEGEPKLLTVAAHVIEAEEADEEEDLSINEVEPDLDDDDFRVRVTDRVQPEEGVTLTDARVVVSGGRGVGSPEGFAVLQELADLLGGAVGCSRVVTNNGWRPHSDQVGQTGARVAPDLYIASGISGAIQHWVGCMGAKKILVINTDKDAPIIAKADYAVIADLHEIIPALSAEVRKLKG
ncbi:MAG: electron transfer flavoprotein subunit alpha/FixB family protein [Ardenticatenaceae bacterium]